MLCYDFHQSHHILIDLIYCLRTKKIMSWNTMNNLSNKISSWRVLNIEIIYSPLGKATSSLNSWPRTLLWSWTRCLVSKLQKNPDPWNLFFQDPNFEPYYWGYTLPLARAVLENGIKDSILEYLRQEKDLMMVPPASPPHRALKSWTKQTHSMHLGKLQTELNINLQELQSSGLDCWNYLKVMALLGLRYTMNEESWEKCIRSCKSSLDLFFDWSVLRVPWLQN